MALPLIYSTASMLIAVATMPKVTTFLRDRYFPTDPATDIFNSAEVLMDIKDGKQRMAPVVLERKKGITVAREGFRTDRMKPPFVAPQRPLTLDDLNARGFGEALFSDMTPEQRAGALLGQDLQDLDIMHNNREEFIAGRCMVGNGYMLPQYSDEYGSDEFIPYEIRFYDGSANPNVYTPAIPWNQDSPAPNRYGDMTIMVRMLTKAGKPVSDFVANPDTIDSLLQDDRIYKMLDNRNMHYGSIRPESLPEGASYYGYVNIDGHLINLFGYNAEFLDDTTGDIEPVFASGQGVLTAPSSGRGLYGAVTQMEPDEEYHTYAGTRIPKYTSDRTNDTRTLRLASRPLYVPRYASPWVAINAFQ